MTKQQLLGRPAARVSAFLLVLLLAALFAAASLLAGCGGGGGGGGGGGTLVVGRVRDSANNDAPVPDARVEIGGKSVLTSHEPGKEGEFSISGVAPGARTATITAPGVDPQTVTLDRSVTAGVTNQVGDLFINIGSVTGRVLKADGVTPAANAFVTILSSGAGTNAEADGHFTLPTVPAGATEITFVLGTQSATVTVTVGESGITDVGDVRLQDDPNPNPPGPPQTIAGTVALPVGAAEPLAGTTVILLRAETNAEIERGVTYDEQGHYGFYVPVGNYRIVARRTGYADAVVDVSVANPSVPATANLTLTR